MPGPVTGAADGELGLEWAWAQNAYGHDVENPARPDN